MLQSLAKSVLSLLSSSDNDRGKDGGRGHPSSGTGPTRKQVKGRITSLHSDYGLIDEETYFPLSALRGKSEPRVGMQVLVQAECRSETGGWRAVHVDPVDIHDGEWDDNRESPGIGEGPFDNIDAEAVNNQYTQYQDSDLPQADEAPAEEPGIGKVTFYDRQTGKGDINGTAPFSSSDITSDFSFVPDRGDWVSVTLVTEAGRTFAKDVKPLRVMNFEGEVTYICRTHGYISREIYFTTDVYGQEQLERGQSVRGQAVESSQGGECNWRALHVEAKRRSPASAFLSTSLAGGGWDNAQLAELCRDKRGIVITGNVSNGLDFGHLRLGQQKTLVLTVRNRGSAPQALCSCYLQNSRSWPKQIELEKIQKQSYQTGQLITINRCQLCALNQGDCLNVRIKLVARKPGQVMNLTVFQFTGYKIAKQITGYVLNEDQPDVKQADMPDVTKSWIIPGVKPSRARPKMNLPNRLLQYAVSGELRYCVHAGEDLLDVRPSLASSLTRSNYAEQFSTLLHLEEIQMEIDITEFFLDRVPMRRVGEYLGLKVPGLAEGRPSVLVGDSIYLSDPAYPDSAPVWEGCVHEVLSDEVLLKFHSEFHQQYDGEDYNVEFTFNRTGLRRCHMAVNFVPKFGVDLLFPSKVTPREPLATLSDTADVVPKLSSGHPKQSQGREGKFFNRQLNQRQQEAVERIMAGVARPTPYVLFGPPGTGKTVTLVEAILQVFLRVPSSRILACAPSNSAADLLAERINESGLVKPGDMVRLNAFHRDEMSIPECILPYCKDGDSIELVARYRLLICTCVSAGQLYALNLREEHFTHAFIDEAGQATEPECVIPMGLAAGDCGQIVLAGDPEQLGPVLRSSLAAEHGLSISLLERLMTSNLYSRDNAFSKYGYYNPVVVTKLVENYRSHPSLLHLPSKLFYHGELQVSADPALTHRFSGWPLLPNSECPLIFHGIRGEDLRDSNSPSWFNPTETLVVVRYLQALLQGDSAKYTVSAEDIGVITPYRKQVEKIRLMMEQFNISGIKVGSTEEFQGQERPVMIISTVRSNDSRIGFDLKHNLGFLRNPKRFNVSITRAQALLIVVGNPYVLAQDEFWRRLLEYAITNKAYTGCSLSRLEALKQELGPDCPSCYPQAFYEEDEGMSKEFCLPNSGSTNQESVDAGSVLPDVTLISPGAASAPDSLPQAENGQNAENDGPSKLATFTTMLEENDNIKQPFKIQDTAKINQKSSWKGDLVQEAIIEGSSVDVPMIASLQPWLQAPLPSSDSSSSSVDQNSCKNIPGHIEASILQAPLPQCSSTTLSSDAATGSMVQLPAENNLLKPSSEVDEALLTAPLPLSSSSSQDSSAALSNSKETLPDRKTGDCQRCLQGHLQDRSAIKQSKVENWIKNSKFTEDGCYIHDGQHTTSHAKDCSEPVATTCSSSARDNFESADDDILSVMSTKSVLREIIEESSINCVKEKPQVLGPAGAQKLVEMFKHTSFTENGSRSNRNKPEISSDEGSHYTTCNETQSGLSDIHRELKLKFVRGLKLSQLSEDGDFISLGKREDSDDQKFPTDLEGNSSKAIAEQQENMAKLSSGDEQAEKVAGVLSPVVNRAETSDQHVGFDEHLKETVNTSYICENSNETIASGCQTGDSYEPVSHEKQEVGGWNFEASTEIQGQSLSGQQAEWSSLEKVNSGGRTERWEDLTNKVVLSKDQFPCQIHRSSLKELDLLTDKETYSETYSTYMKPDKKQDSFKNRTVDDRTHSTTLSNVNQEQTKTDDNTHLSSAKPSTKQDQHKQKTDKEAAFNVWSADHDYSDHPYYKCDNMIKPGSANCVVEHKRRCSGQRLVMSPCTSESNVTVSKSPAGEEVSWESVTTESYIPKGAPHKMSRIALLDKVLSKTTDSESARKSSSVELGPRQGTDTHKHCEAKQEMHEVLNPNKLDGGIRYEISDKHLKVTGIQDGQPYLATTVSRSPAHRDIWQTHSVEEKEGFEPKHSKGLPLKSVISQDVSPKKTASIDFSCYSTVSQPGCKEEHKGYLCTSADIPNHGDHANIRKQMNTPQYSGPQNSAFDASQTKNIHEHIFHKEVQKCQHPTGAHTCHNYSVCEAAHHSEGSISDEKTVIVKPVEPAGHSLSSPASCDDGDSNMAPHPNEHNLSFSNLSLNDSLLHEYSYLLDQTDSDVIVESSSSEYEDD